MSKLLVSKKIEIMKFSNLRKIWYISIRWAWLKNDSETEIAKLQLNVH